MRTYQVETVTTLKSATEVRQIRIDCGSFSTYSQAAIEAMYQNHVHEREIRTFGSMAENAEFHVSIYQVDKKLLKVY